MNGSLFVRAGVQAGRTVLRECRGTYPLQVLRPHTASSGDAGGGLSLVMLLLSGGLLDGDCMSIEVEVESGARLALRTQAATQVHAGRSAQYLLARVAAGACFSYVPNAVVPHRGAEYLARTRVVLDDGAQALIADSLSPGRTAFGERFAYRQVRLELDVEQHGALMARERAFIRPDPASPVHGAQWGPFSHVGSAYMIGSAATPQLPETAAGRRVGTSALARGGWFVRVLADRATAIDEVLCELSARWWQKVPVDLGVSAKSYPGNAHTLTLEARR